MTMSSTLIVTDEREVEWNAIHPSVRGNYHRPQVTRCCVAKVWHGGPPQPRVYEIGGVWTPRYIIHMKNGQIHTWDFYKGSREWIINGDPEKDWNNGQ